MAEIVQKWEAPAALQSYLTTGLDSLANAAGVLGAKIDNVANGENVMFMAVELYVAQQGSARSSGAYFSLYMVPSVDDSNFGDVVGTLDPAYMVARFVLDAAVTARYCVATDIPIPPLDFKMYIVNSTGQALPSSGSTLKYRLYSMESQ